MELERITGKEETGRKAANFQNGHKPGLGHLSQCQAFSEGLSSFAK